MFHHRYIVRLLIPVIGTHKPQAALIHMRVRPFCEPELPALQNDVFRIVDADMPVGVNIVPRVDALAKGLVADVFLHHLLRADHEGLITTARACSKGKRLDIIVRHEVQWAFRGGIAHLDHAIAQLIIPDVEFLRQLFPDRLQLVSHMQLQIANAVQFFCHSPSEQCVRNLQTLSAHMRLPLNPLNGTALVFL